MEDWGKYEDRFRYMMLDRLRQDCNYYLGYGGRNPNCLWANDEKAQIENMKAIWNTFPMEDTPEWLTWKDILEFERKMCRDLKGDLDMKNFDYEHDPKTYTFEFDTRAGAEDALAAMRDILDTYGVVSVADLCDYLDELHAYTATKYGWVKLDAAKIVRTMDAYILELPRAVSIV